MTDNEIVQEAKLILKEDYGFENVYSNISLVGFVEVEGNKVYVDWNSSNNNLINVEENQSSVMKNIGYVPEISKLPPELKVLEFLTYT